MRTHDQIERLARWTRAVCGASLLVVAGVALLLFGEDGLDAYTGLVFCVLGGTLVLANGKGWD